ncbi:YwdI family protein [Peribacillus sp. SCS-155]|uniref:YwdI family protein n=1 Tax=Peribacillus sedimenti TaxID=3115297 RepID=UPI003906B6C6
MDISAAKVFNKMEDLINRAKTADSIEKRNGYITAVQALCELMTEGTGMPSSSTSGTGSSQNSYSVHMTANTVPVQPTAASAPAAKPVRMDDANGDSLFDF